MATDDRDGTDAAQLSTWLRDELGLDPASTIEVREKPGTDPRCSPIVTEVTISSPGETAYSFPHRARPDGGDPDGRGGRNRLRRRPLKVFAGAPRSTVVRLNRVMNDDQELREVEATVTVLITGELVTQHELGAHAVPVPA